MNASFGDFGSEQYGRITKMAKAISSDETRFRFAIGQIRLIEESLDDGSDKTVLVKRLVNWALQLFNKIGDFKSDVRMLYLWKLLGKYSVELKMEGVLKKVNELGFFKSAPEFYFIWAEHLAEQSNREKFDSVVSLCLQNCKFTSENSNQLFGPLVRLHFNEDRHGDTASLLDMLDHNKSAVKGGIPAQKQSETRSDTSKLEGCSETIDTRNLTTSVHTAQEFTVEELEAIGCDENLHSSPPTAFVESISECYSWKNIKIIDFRAEEQSGIADFSSIELVDSPFNATSKNSVSNNVFERSRNLIDDSPSMTLCKKVLLGRQQFHILKLVHEGEFAKVFLATSADGKSYALKQVQSHEWEIYMAEELKNRLSPALCEFIVQIRDAYAYSNLSVIVRDYYPYGTLQDLAIAYKNVGFEINGLLVTFFGVQLANFLGHIHSARIIHARLQPGSVYLTQSVISCDSPLEELLRIPSIRVADWGKSINMREYQDGKEFFGRSESKDVHCIEMISDKPWNYQVDFYGFVQIFHYLLLGDEITTVRSQGRIRPVRAMKRGVALRSMWMEIFDEFLNIPNCDSLPSWSQISLMMREKLLREVDDKQEEWRKALDDYNAYTKGTQ